MVSVTRLLSPCLLSSAMVCSCAPAAAAVQARVWSPTGTADRGTAPWVLGKKMGFGCSLHRLGAGLNVERSLMYPNHLSLLLKSWGLCFHSEGSCKEPPSLSLWPSYLCLPSLNTQNKMPHRRAAQITLLQSPPLNISLWTTLQHKTWACYFFHNQILSFQKPGTSNQLLHGRQPQPVSIQRCFEMLVNHFHAQWIMLLIKSDIWLAWIARPYSQLETYLARIQKQLNQEVAFRLKTK